MRATTRQSGVNHNIGCCCFVNVVVIVMIVVIAFFQRDEPQVVWRSGVRATSKQSGVNHTRHPFSRPRASSVPTKPCRA